MDKLDRERKILKRVALISGKTFCEERAHRIVTGEMVPELNILRSLERPIDKNSKALRIYYTLHYLQQFRKHLIPSNIPFTLIILETILFTFSVQKIIFVRTSRNQAESMSLYHISKF